MCGGRLSEPRVAKSSWAVGWPSVPSNQMCSIFLHTLDVPNGLFNANATQSATMHEIRAGIFRKSTRLAEEAAKLNPKDTHVLYPALRENPGWQNAEGFFGSAVFHAARPLGPLVLHCAVTMLRKPLQLQLLRGRQSMRC